MKYLICMSTLAALLITPTATHSQNLGGQLDRPRTCSQVTLARPGVGHAYNGLVENEDYHFALRIPDGLTGWSGVAESAPFHGFSIFLDPAGKSCIVFEIHVRVDDADAHAPEGSARRILVGQARGWQSAKTDVDRTEIITEFTYKDYHQTNDGTVTLIAPKMDRRSLSTYNKFVQSITETLRNK